MIATVGLYNERHRKRPWLVSWWGLPDPETGRQKKYTKAFKYKRDALDFQAAKREDLGRGGFRDPPKDMLLGQLFDEFMMARTGHLKHGSQVCYQSTMAHLREHFGNDRPIGRIERRHAERFMSAVARRDGRYGPLSSSTKAQILKNSRAIFNAAVDWGYIRRNPFAASRAGTTPLRVKIRRRPWHHLTPDQFGRLLQVVPLVRRRALYWLMFGCGLRPGEAYNLTLDNIDLEDRRVPVENRAATDHAPPFTIKAEGASTDSKERSVPIPRAAIPDLATAVKGAFRAGGFVGLTPQRFAAVQRNWRLCRHGKPWGGRAEHRPWKNSDLVNNLLRDTKGYLRKAKIDLTSPFTLTTFRKSFGQNHADHGTPPRTLAKLLGHSDVSITMEFYNRVTDANERAAAQTVDRMFSDALGTPAVEEAG